MTVEQLYQYAEDHSIEVDEYPMQRAKSLSVRLPDGNCSVAIDRSRIGNQCEMVVVIGHELGHCSTMSFYSMSASQLEKKRDENRADKWAIKKLVPKDELENLITHGTTEVLEIADYFNVTPEFAYKAMWYYQNGNLAVERLSA